MNNWLEFDMTETQAMETAAESADALANEALNATNVGDPTTAADKITQLRIQIGILRVKLAAMRVRHGG